MTNCVSSRGRGSPASGSPTRHCSRPRSSTRPTSVSSGGLEQWDRRGHFFAAAALAMRRILVERARHYRRIKHGAGGEHVEVDEALPGADPDLTDVIAIDEALSQPRGRPTRARRRSSRFATSPASASRRPRPRSISRRRPSRTNGRSRAPGSFGRSGVGLRRAAARHEPTPQPRGSDLPCARRPRRRPTVTRSCRSGADTIRSCARKWMRCSRAIDAADEASSIRRACRRSTWRRSTDRCSPAPCSAAFSCCRRSAPAAWAWSTRRSRITAAYRRHQGAASRLSSSRDTQAIRSAKPKCSAAFSIRASRRSSPFTRRPPRPAHLVMELVSGPPITEYVQAHALERTAAHRATDRRLRGGAARARSRHRPSGPEAGECAGVGRWPAEGARLRHRARRRDATFIRRSRPHTGNSSARSPT